MVNTQKQMAFFYPNHVYNKRKWKKSCPMHKLRDAVNEKDSRPIIHETNYNILSKNINKMWTNGNR